ncbi:anaerobic sulfatase maturase [Prevotella sp. HMSC077E09]|uniref:anaerobic sulfatase-maturation protein n=1 Tax=Prevotella sp. HMSC077E09 TaxID=1739487 RepID=UPI0008A4F9EF|nr:MULTISPECIES: anaerobic sulfatase-maturation protein [unclassified Prevotella]OFO84013.1 anaerobic sulfatase maturase [Prevotella sp. HMSC077E08]OFP55075.1 anaerobic sulfatase maturase [Prevotella sp. HMSC077E09]
MTTISPFARPLYVMLKPVGAACNLACNYCYYLEKSNLYKHQPKRQMSEELLERFVKDYIEAQTMNEVVFTWHGGEPTLRPLSFYQKAVELQKKYAGGRVIHNSLQTNGTLLTDEWCRFLKANNWLVGISIDGPEAFHDRYRRDSQGRPSWQKVMEGIQLLQHYGVEWNAMAVVNRYNADHPQAFYRFFKSIGCQYIQFTPIVERNVQHADGRHLASINDATDAPVTDFSVTPEQWGNFLCGLFDEWVKQDIGRVFVQIFDSMLANWVGVAPGTCIYAKECGHAGVMEFNGDVYSCDHFVFPQYKLGNINEHTLIEMLYGEKQRRFSQLKYNKLPRQCKECRWAFACHGECPKNRFVNDRYGNPGLNYLCAGYRRFFEHIAPTMDEMKKAFTVE